MDTLPQDIARSAAKAVAMAESRPGSELDYSEASLAVAESMLEEASNYADQMTADELQTLTQDFGCYILEVARREFGGTYLWFEQRDQPILVVGEPTFRIALLAWDKVRGRLSGDAADNIPFCYAGFAQRVRQAVPGEDALYV